MSCGGFTLDGKFVFSGGEDGTVRVWQPKSGACRHVFEVHEAMVTCCARSSDGDLLISGENEKDFITLYNEMLMKIIK